MIIGVCGFINSGKGTVGDLLEQKGFKKDSFAAPLKDAISCIFNWPRELLEGDTEVSRNWREIPDVFWSEKFEKPFSPRLALQLMGTEAGRNIFHEDLWVLAMINRVKNSNVVITDVRFKNEIEYIQNNGGHVIRIKRGPEPNWFKTAVLANSGIDIYREEMFKLKIHPSEWDWIGCELDYTIENDDDIQCLDKKVELMLKQFRG